MVEILPKGVLKLSIGDRYTPSRKFLIYPSEQFFMIIQIFLYSSFVRMWSHETKTSFQEFFLVSCLFMGWRFWSRSWSYSGGSPKTLSPQETWWRHTSFLDFRGWITRDPRKISLPSSTKCRSPFKLSMAPTEFEHAPDRGMNEVTIYESVLEGGLRGKKSALIVEISLYFGISPSQLISLTWWTLITIHVLREFQGISLVYTRSYTHNVRVFLGRIF